MSLGIRTTPSKNQLPGRLVMLAIAAILLIATILFFRMRISMPVDGIRLETTKPIYKADGILVTAQNTLPGGIKQGDVITAVDGISMQTWAKELFNSNSAKVEFHIGQPVVYTVLRRGISVNVPIIYKRYSVKQLISSHWGTLVFALITQIVAIFVFWRRPDDLSARLLFLFAFLGCNAYAWSFGLMANDLINKNGFWYYSIFIHVVWLLYWSAALHFALVFPHESQLLRGHPGRRLWIYVGALAFFFSYIGVSYTQSKNVLEWIGSWSTAGYIVPLLYLGGMVGVMTWNYWHTDDGAARKKIRWAVYGAFISGFGGLVLWIIPPIFLGWPLISPNLMGLMVTVFPVTLAIAIVRYQLFDIDLIINRTLVYSLLTAILTIVFLFMVVLLQFLIRSITGQNSQFSIVLSTLLILLLFTPLKEFLQNFIDLRFFRHKYDAQKAVEKFTKKVRNMVEAEQIKEELLTTVDQTLQPEHSQIWLRNPEGNLKSRKLE
jgi:hypothetical protein